VCKVGEFVNKEGKCEKLCKAGYMSVDVKGGKYCVEKCKDGYEVMGDSCVALDKAFEPKKCDKLSCGLFHSMFFLKGAEKDAYSAEPTYGAAYKVGVGCWVLRRASCCPNPSSPLDARTACPALR
jgi:hypothetical protein